MAKVLDEYISVGTARGVYGVVIDPTTLTLNEAATHALWASQLPLTGPGHFCVGNWALTNCNRRE